MKILFINPPNSPFTEKSLLIEPIDLVSLASFIESKGNQVKLLDMDVEEMSPAECEPLLKEFRPDLVIMVYDYSIPLHISACLDNVLQIAHLAQRYQSKVILGGKLATFLPEKLIYENSPIDIAVTYEMEFPLLKLIEIFPWEDDKLKNVPSISYWHKKLVKNPLSKEKFNIDELPVTNRRLVNLKNYIDVRTILSSRGCFMKCSFCHVPGFWGNWRGQSPETVIEEIESLVKNYGAKKILFLDDNATVDKSRMRKICQLIIDRNIEASFGCLGTIVSYDPITMQKMYEAGFKWIHFGVESGDDQILKNINKLTSSKEVRRVIDETRKIGFRIRTSWIFDLPGTTRESLERTIELILQTKSDEIRLHFLSLRLGSQYYQEFSGADFPEQYIHNSETNVKVHQLSPEYLKDKLQELLSELEKHGYTVIKDPQQFRELEKIKKTTPNLKIVSLCPLRYGLNW